jgi:hypothetical protein
VHGYDINCLSILNTKSTQSTEEDVKLCSNFVSGGDEKVLRIFDAPYSFVKSFN